MEKYSKIAKDFLNGWDVLVVDDQEDALQLIEDILSEYGAKVHLARNGAEGLALVQEIMPKFIISDIAMPVMDGWEMADKLKANPHTQHIPIIALTAYSDAEDRKMAMSKGFHNYLPKPLRPGILMSQILILLEDAENVGSEIASKVKTQEHKSV